MRSVIKYLHMKGKTPLQIFHEINDGPVDGMEAIKGTIPKESKGISFGRQGHANLFWDAEADCFTCMHKHEQRILFRSHKVSKAGNDKEKKEKKSKRTCPSPPRQCTTTSGRRHHGNFLNIHPSPLT